MVDKALGAYEVGFLDLRFPRTPISVGSRWSKMVQLGDENLTSSSNEHVSGALSPCSFKFESLDTFKRMAVISFVCQGNVAYSTKPLPQTPGRRVKFAIKESGLWKIDLATGIPISFHADRSMRTDWVPGGTVESTTTDVSSKK